MNENAFVEDGRIITGRRIDAIAQSAPPVPMIAVIALADPDDGEWPLRRLRVLAMLTCIRHARRPEDDADGDAVTLDWIVTAGEGAFHLSSFLERPGSAATVVEESAFEADPRPFLETVKASALSRARDEGLDIDFEEAAANLTPTAFSH